VVGNDTIHGIQGSHGSQGDSGWDYQKDSEQVYVLVPTDHPTTALRIDNKYNGIKKESQC
jgi:hypothetical protein